MVFGLPQRIRGHANIGKYHDIVVEDEVTAYFEHENGMVGHFTSLPQRGVVSIPSLYAMTTSVFVSFPIFNE
ncbi:hypothetical protein SAMN04487897_14612 [Paenibacillus sp. yr247]|nr:hypothetical protein SAMN04487897_14612 [Paenibacillus sp. yr247]